MELNREGITLFVDASRTNTSCDQCSASHLKCDKGVPACQRCLKVGKKCTRSRNKFDGRIIHGFSKEGWELQEQKLLASTWAQVINAHNHCPMTRARLWNLLLPLELLLPLPAHAGEILQLSSNISKTPLHPSETTKYFHLSYPQHEIQETLITATNVFFHMFNPFFPLFSQETFYSRPRSNTLKKIIAQIGLERMRQTDLVKTAMHTNNLNHTDITRLPNTFDTLQCLLLAQFGIRQSWIDGIRFRITCTIDHLASLLGLHMTCNSSPQWLERTLALYLTTLVYSTYSSCKSIMWLKRNCLKSITTHRKSAIFIRLSQQNHFCFSDHVHFVTSQTIFHSKTILLQANRDYKLALKNRSRAASFTKLFTNHLESLHENLVWGRSYLSQCTPTSQSHTTLLRQSRLALALRYNTDYIELMKLGSYIPSNSLCRISSTFLTCTFNKFSTKGLELAMHSIRMASTITLAPFGFEILHILISAMAYIMAHLVESKKVVGRSQALEASFSQGIFILNQAKRHPFFNETATTYRRIFTFLMDYHAIPLPQ
ncbi:hypothetical protein DSO57_1028893 [Entomophthora muscae]|uniref:Uncharacterized protein n=1 Tax=Entomophthora muscae TaxID=34485 RepID=A0ACC2SDZ4_9FUNG|nr:hypothetical protein DSO57_1028893 [Entomophthora muscae]